MMNQAKKARLEDELHVEELEEAEDDAMEEMQEEEEEEEVGEMTSRSLVLETDRFPHILGRILSFLDPLSVKRASLVSR